MSAISPLTAYSAAPIRPAIGLAPSRIEPGPLAGAPRPEAPFGALLDQAISRVEQSQTAAEAVTRPVLLGDNPNLHQSVLAMQEASLSFGLMVQVRNKLVESYQELMRLPV